MNNILLSWASSHTFSNKWDRLAKTKKGTYVAAWVWMNEEEQYHSNIFNTLPEGDPIITKICVSLQEAQDFANKELKRQGFQF